jgi:hypothetical protein
MIDKQDSAAAFFERMRQKTPELLALLSAETDEEFDSALNPVLEKAVRHLEENKKNFTKLKEEGLTAALAGNIRILNLIQVEQETNSNGHVDLIIKSIACRQEKVRLGEAKIYDGFEYHISGLEQLIDRYSTGRDPSGILIEYIRKANIKKLVNDLRNRMDKELPLQQTDKSAEHKIKWSFITYHKHSSGEDLKVQHICCNLFQ